MRSPTILLARHGQTEWNALGRRQGQLDSPLTQAGRAHAEALGRVAERLGADAVFSSPIGRALTTAKIAAERLGVRVVVLDELAELHHGDFAGLTTPEIEQQWPDLWQARAHNPFTWRFPGGESYADADLRVTTVLQRISVSAPSLPLIVTHEMIGRMLRRQLEGLTPADALRLDQPNDVLLRIEGGRETPILL